MALAQITQAKAQLAQSQGSVSDLELGELTPKERRGLFKARLGGNKVLPALVSLTTTRPNLVPGGVTPQSLQASMEIFQAFSLYASALSGASQRASDTARQMESEIYKIGLGIYAIAERNTHDPEVAAVVLQMKSALATGPRNPKRQVTTLPKPTTVTYTDPNAAAAAAAAADQVTATNPTTGKGKKKAPAAPAGSSGSISTTSSTTPTTPQVPVYTPGGPAGTAPATNGPGSSTQS